MHNLPRRHRHLNEMNLKRYARDVELIEFDDATLASVVKRFGGEVDGAANIFAVKSIMYHNHEAIIAFRNRLKGDLGCIIYLPLNVAGHAALIAGTFDTVHPDPALICKAGERPVSIYVWGLHICHRTAGGIALAMDKAETSLMKGAEFYCRAANEKARRLLLSLGFEDGAVICGEERSDLLHFKRRKDSKQYPNDLEYRVRTQVPAYATYDPTRSQGAFRNRPGVKVVHRFDELMQVMAVRAASYLPEQTMPYAEDVDGNDFCAAHLIGYIGDEPAAALRLRFFAEFTKLERLAVLPRFRGSSIASRIIRAGIDYGRDKGYTRFYGQTEEAVFPIWKRAGFTLRNTPGVRYCTDREYREGDLFVEHSPHAITPYAGPHVILRREGEWHRSGAFETSTSGDQR